MLNELRNADELLKSKINIIWPSVGTTISIPLDVKFGSIRFQCEKIEKL